MATTSLGLLGTHRAPANQLKPPHEAPASSRQSRTQPVRFGSIPFGAHADLAQGNLLIEPLRPTTFGQRVAKRSQESIKSVNILWKPSLVTGFQRVEPTESQTAPEGRTSEPSMFGTLGIWVNNPAGYPPEPAEVAADVARGDELFRWTDETIKLGNLISLPEAELKEPTVQVVSSDAAADAFATANGIAAQVSKIGELCIRLIPGASKVNVSLHHDQDDDSVRLHFSVRAAAKVNEVVASEDRLHLAIFDSVRVEDFPAFSIGYELGS